MALADAGFYSDNPQRKVMSLEMRARLIGDATTSLPVEGRRERVEKLALEHLRAAVAIGSLKELADD